MDDELSDEQLAAWEAFVYAHAAIMSRIERDMFEAKSISLTWYDVLVALSNAPDQTLRMGELAENLVLSRSGLTRLIGRIERSGLVRREPSVEDGRGAVAILTEAGSEAVEHAWPLYAKAVSKYFGSSLSGVDVRSITSALGRVRDLDSN